MSTSNVDPLALLASVATILAVLISAIASVIKIFWQRAPSKFVKFHLWGTVICTILVIFFADANGNYLMIRLYKIMAIHTFIMILIMTLRNSRILLIFRNYEHIWLGILIITYDIFSCINQYIDITVPVQWVGLMLTTLSCTLVIYISTMIIMPILCILKALDSVMDFCINSLTGYILIWSLMYLISDLVARYIWPLLWLHISAFLQLA